MKTATIRINHIFGTSGEFCADVMYRGKLLHSFDGKIPNDLSKAAHQWAKNQGFTHMRVTFG